MFKLITKTLTILVATFALTACEPETSDSDLEPWCPDFTEIDRTQYTADQLNVMSHHDVDLLMTIDLLTDRTKSVILVQLLEQVSPERLGTIFDLYLDYEKSEVLENEICDGR